MGLFGPPNIEKLKVRKNIKGLIEALKDKDEDVRKRAAWALGKIGDARAWLNKGAILARRQQYDGANNCYDTAIEALQFDLFHRDFV